MTDHYLITLNISLVDAFKKQDFTFLASIKNIYQTYNPYSTSQNEITPNDDNFAPLGGPIVVNEENFEFSYFVFVSFYIDYYLTTFQIDNKDFEEKIKGFFDPIFNAKLKKYFESNINQIGFSTSLLKNLYAFYNTVPICDESTKETDISNFWNFTTHNKYAKGQDRLFDKECLSSYWLYAYLNQNVYGWGTLHRALGTKDGLFEEQMHFYLAYSNLWHDSKKKEFKEDPLIKGYFKRIAFSLSVSEEELQQKISYLDNSFQLYWTNSISVINQASIDDEVKDLNGKIQEDAKILNERFSGNFKKKSGAIKQDFSFNFLRRASFGIPDLVESASKQLDLSYHNNIFYRLISDIFKETESIKQSTVKIDGKYYENDDIINIADFRPDEKYVLESHYIQSEHIVTKRDNDVLNYMNQISNVEGLSLLYDTYLKKGAIKFNISEAKIPKPRKLKDDEIKIFLQKLYHYDEQKEMYIEPLGSGITLSFSEQEFISLFRNNLYEYHIVIKYDIEFDLEKILIYNFTDKT